MVPKRAGMDSRKYPWAFGKTWLYRRMKFGPAEKSRLGSLFIFGTERFIRGKDIQATLTLREGINLEKIQQS